MTEHDLRYGSRSHYRSRWLKLFAFFVLFSCAPKQEEMKTAASVVPNDWTLHWNRCSKMFRNFLNEVRLRELIFSTAEELVDKLPIETQGVRVFGS